MIFKEYRTIYPLKYIWKAITSTNSTAIYQSFEFNVLYYQYRVTSVSNIRKGNTACRFIVGYENGDPKCIAPLAIDKSPKKTIRLLGHGTNAGYLDYIYEDPKSVNKLHNYVVEKYSDFDIDFIFVSENSPLYGLLNVSDTFNNYAIHFNGYETYFNSLSKSTKQNIRTAYNRMKTDEKEYVLSIYTSYEQLGKMCLTEINQLYHKRKADWIDGQPIDKKTQNKVLRRDVIYQGVRKLDNPVIAVLRIDSVIAAFFIGFSYDNGVCIPRLAIDIEYGRYSPGVVLINEFLKTLPDNAPYIFDLCRGDEKYKSSLGGEKSLTYRLSKEPEEKDV